MKLREVLDEIGECLNYLAFMDEKDHAFVQREFGGGEEIVASVALVQSILSDLYDGVEESLSAMKPELISDFDRENVYEVMRSGDWFTSAVLRLCAHADLSNIERIRLGFPETVAAFEAWHSGDSQKLRKEES